MSMENEIWAPARYIFNDGTVVTFSNYEVSNMERLKHKNYFNSGREEIRDYSNPLTDKKYLNVGLYENKKMYTCSFHRLVISSFIKDTDVYESVNHKDENTHNNRLENLEWCTQEYNSNYGTGKFRCVESRKLNNNLKKL
jgi:hypothetical protein